MNRTQPSRPRHGGFIHHLAVVVLVALGAVVPHAAAHAVDDGSIGIRPASESDFFHLSVPPGGSVESTAIVSNTTSEPITVLTYPVDAVSDPTGAFAMAAENDPRVGVGAWALLEAEEVEVPARSEVPVTFRLTVPPGTPAGDYAGAIIMQTPPVPGETTDVDGVAVRIDVVQRQGVRIYLDVEGSAVDALETAPLEWRRDGDDLVVSVAMHNSGTTVLSPEAVIAIEGWPAATELHVDAPDALLPGARVEVQARWTDAPMFLIGSAHAAVTSEAGTERTSATVVYSSWLVLTILAAAVLVALLAVWRAAVVVRRRRGGR